MSSKNAHFLPGNSRVYIAAMALVVAVALSGCVEEGNRNIPVNGTPLVTANVKDSLEAYKGKIVILDFWATWCGPCRMEIPGFVTLQEKYRSRGLEIVGVSVDPLMPHGNPGGAPAVAPFMKENGINYTIWMVNNAEALRGYDVSRGIPKTYILDRKGNVVREYLGAQNASVFENDINKLL
ncbi:MAG TPA: TlpA disulfide reductase family protein [Blastocatellia bacterium]|nr:TlpA disulfide reductase family protein [Blastocatellia bacterium]